jgi:hypothetical protein
MSSLNKDNIFTLFCIHDHFLCNIEKYGAATNLLCFIFLVSIVFLDLTNISEMYAQHSMLLIPLLYKFYARNSIWGGIFRVHQT